MRAAFSGNRTNGELTERARDAERPATAPERKRKGGDMPPRTSGASDAVRFGEPPFPFETNQTKMTVHTTCKAAAEHPPPMLWRSATTPTCEQNELANKKI